jgi:pimeloyl-ACP methyl ester carboxylesterase
MELEFTIDDITIEASWHGPPSDAAPTLALLHEGLGCVAMWRDFPQQLATRTGCGVLAYSRRGYGKSGARPLPWPVTYMRDEAFDVLPRVLDEAGVRDCILVGHSDGASIATIYAGGRQDFRVHGLVLMAPHFFVEDVSIKSIEAAKQAYEHGDLRARLLRYHDHVEVAFRGWNDAWLNPHFRNWRIDDAVTHVRVPMLIIQGADDQYGTVAQVKLAQDEAYCPVEALVLEKCRHAPQVDQPEATLSAIADFAQRVLVVHEQIKITS